MKRKIVAIIGDAKIEKDGLKYQLAFNTGKALIDAGYRIQSGGLGGVMEAAFKGAHSSKNYREGDTVALVPSFDATVANPYADIIIPTGLDVMRNALVANASAVVAVGGGAGTLSEIAFAWSLFRMVLAFENADGWSGKVANTRMDARIRYPEIGDDRVYGVKSADEAVKLINERVEKYNRYHGGIEYAK